jgi:TatD DNase family protein
MTQADGSEKSIELIDTHCHIQSAGNSIGEHATRELWAGDSALTGDTIIARAHEAGVSQLICVGCDLEDSHLAIDFVKQRQNCWASVGIHPHEAQHYATNSEKKAAFAALIREPKVIGIGECGLDYFYQHSPKADQLTLLHFQFQLAQDADLPMIFHVREALDDFWPVFDSYNTAERQIRGVLHSFTDNRANLEKALQRGLYIGVNGIATFAKSETQLAVYRSIPLDRILLETDAPFLTPVPYRGTINESKYIRVIADFIAKLRGESFENLSYASTSNARTHFGLTKD